MPKKSNKVESFLISLSSENDLTFEDLISSDLVNGREYKVKGKHVTLNVISDNSNYVIGLITTSRRDSIPPKTNSLTKTVEPLGLLEHEGLGYANVFLFEKARKILMYETNQHGCFIDHFIEYLYRCCKSGEPPISNVGINNIL